MVRPLHVGIYSHQFGRGDLLIKPQEPDVWNQLGVSKILITEREYTDRYSVYYMPTVLVTNVGVERNTALLVAGFVQLMFVIGNTLPALALDRMGRKWTMIWGCAGLCICMAMIAILLSFGGGSTSSAAIAFFFLYMLIFGGTINVVPWVYGPEILPLNARTRGTSISVSAHWLWSQYLGTQHMHSTKMLTLSRLLHRHDLPGPYQ